jgi:peptidoglycan hydrolase CwlO-like protein
MSVTQYQNTVNSLDKEIADLEKKKAVKDKEIATLQDKINSVKKALQKIHRQHLLVVSKNRLLLTNPIK